MSSNFLALRRGKKVLAFFCSATLMLGTFALGDYQSVKPYFNVEAANQTAVTTDYLNVRSGPGTSYSVITVLNVNSTVTVLDGSSTDSWVKVQSETGAVGYCSSAYLKFDNVKSNSTPSTFDVTGITLDYLNVRTGPATTYKVITVLDINTIVNIIDNSNTNWAKIKLNDGTVGFVSKSYLKINYANDNNSIDEYKVVKTKTTATSLDYLNIRTGAGLTYKVILTVAPNTVMTVLDNSNANWAKVQLSNGTVGYCSKQYAKINTVSSTNYVALRDGNEGEAVRMLQNRLTELKYYNGAISGIYDSSLVLAVKNFQIVSGMSNKDGIADENTLAKIYDASAPTATTTIKLSSANVNLSIGNTYKLTATTTPSNRAVKYSSSDNSVATVSSNGTITGVNVGSAVITVKDTTGTVVAKSNVKVSEKDALPPDINFSTTKVSLYVGDTYTVKTMSDEEGVYWSLDNDKVVTNDNGKVTVIGAGQVKVSAYNKNNSLIAECIITAENKPEITLNKSNIKIEVNEEYQLSVTVNPSDTKLVYTSSNEKVAVVENGKIKGISNGTAIITVKDVNSVVSKKCTVTVGTGTITLNKSSISLNRGSSEKLTVNTEGEIGSIVWTTSNPDVAAVKDGVISAISKGTATITAKSSLDDTVKATCKVTVNDVAVSSRITLSGTSGSLTVGKTKYISATSTYSLTWSSSDTSVATVNGGFITAVSEGKAIITAKDSRGNVKFYTVNVLPAEPVKFVYTTPNSALVNKPITLYAITDKSRTDVRFIIDVNGKEKTINASSKKVDGNTYVWTATTTVDEIGTFDVRAESLLGNKWSTCNDAKTDLFVTSEEIRNKALVRELRVTDTVIDMIVDFEGFLSVVEPDQLTSSYIPNIGYGHVIWSNDEFYNGITKNEAYAMLRNSINKDSYTTKVNSFFINNNIKFKQQHFDAMVCFSYNLGVGWTSSSAIRNYFLNTIDPNAAQGNTGVYTAKVISDTGLYVRKGPGTSYEIVDLLNYNETVTLLETKMYNQVWCRVRLSNGVEGYCSSTYLSISASVSDVVRNCDYINKKAFVAELIQYHHAGGNCYYGLLWRRGDELEMFLYGDYVQDGRKNKYGFPDSTCLPW